MEYSRDEDGLPRKERELTLSMSAILGIFFGLVLLCGLFFGLGYNMRGRQIATAASGDPDAENSTNPAFNNFKPAAGSPAGSKPTVIVAPNSASSTGGVAATVVTGANSSNATAHASTPAGTAAPATGATAPTGPAPIVRLAPPMATSPTAAHPATGTITANGGGPVSAPATAAAPPVTGSFVVQVAAVSHQEDADLLMGALKGRGYAVSARTEPQDKLVHIQIGPFNNRKDADAMRQRLASDGYNAIIK